MTFLPDIDLINRGLSKEDIYCGRCGALYFGRQQGAPPPHCFHMNTADPDITPAHAERIRARWELGKRYNPDHDTADYRDGATGIYTRYPGGSVPGDQSLGGG